MSKKLPNTQCVPCMAVLAPGDGPDKTVLLAFGMIQQHSLATVIEHLCPEHELLWRAFAAAAGLAGRKTAVS